MKKIAKFLVIAACSCGDSSSSQHETADSMPVVKPPVHDTSRVITPPPTGDSNVIYPDSSVDAR